MTPLVLALAAALALPSLAAASLRFTEPRLHPRDAATTPTYVRKVESALVGLKVRARADAQSSARLGVHRFASSIVFDPRGYAVTVSYALMDALEIEAVRRDGRTVAAQVVGFDLDSGLGVVKLDGDGFTAATLGQSSDVREAMLTGTVSVDEDNDLVHATGAVRSVRRFSASWEYMLERAFIVAPAISSWGGSALVNERGEVVGIGSLRLGEKPYTNMFIPIDRFVPVKDEVIATGRVQSRAPRPWLGLYTSADDDGSLTVDGFSPIGPAAQAGFRRGDRIVSVNGVDVKSQEDFYETLWRHRAGEVIKVAVRRQDRVMVIPVHSVDRHRALTGGRP
ncbi:MAG TPA: S1C family serine protease [Terriglobales bacterium]|nr:S1C family serine protease [Terriglobales bacterium]